MKPAAIALVLAGLTGADTPAGAEPAFLPDGAYEVSVRLELPNVEDTGVAARIASVCIRRSDAGTGGMAVLGDGNPLRGCPTLNVRDGGGILTFDIVCPGADAATGAARFTLGSDRFEGTIAVKMGGKNMTMIERQSARRVGSCQPPARS